MALVAALSAWDEPSTSFDGAARYLQFANAMATIREYVHPRNVNGPRSTSKPVETPEVKSALAIVINSGRAAEIYADFTAAVDDCFHLVKEDMKRYLDGMNQPSITRDQRNKIVAELLDKLAVWQRSWGVPLKPFKNPKFIPAFTAQFHQLLHSSLPASFQAHFADFLASSLPHHPASSPPTAATIKASSPSPHLSRLGFLHRYSATLSQVANREIELIAKDEAALGWDTRRLAKAKARVNESVAAWLSNMFEGEQLGNEATQQALRPMFARFEYHLCKCFFDIRTDELFDIIVEYPDSMAALEDLKECLFKVDQRSQLVEKLQAANVKRLLHPGAETKDVLTQYISTIRCLRILDPLGVLLHKIAKPIRRHLRDRPDTIKCIVATLVEGEELQDENELNAGTGIIGQDGDEEAEDFANPRWEPEPVDAAPEFRSGKAGDIVSTLVSIYETREVIIKELQVLLAARLLAVRDYDAVKEIRTIELLKIRFGEAVLQVCDVMLKDMADSKRINDHIKGELQSSVQPLVISRMFWPPVPSSSLRLPPKLQHAQQQYEAAFHHFKPDKHLRWYQNLGTVAIKLELEDRIVEVEATPLQASIVELFEASSEMTVESLRQGLGVSESLVKAGLAWWRERGVLKEVSDGSDSRWTLLEVAE